MFRTIMGLSSMLMIIVVSVIGCTKADSSPKDQFGQKEAAQVCVSGTCAEIKPADAAVPAAEKADNVMVYYFHNTRRCRTCLGIQQTIEETIQKQFNKETTAGLLVYKDVNIDEPANQHFIQEYQVSFSTMVVAAMRGGKRVKYETCEKVWDFAHDQPKLTGYIAETIGAYLKQPAMK